MANIAILATGKVTTAIAHDLMATHQVTVIDDNKAALSLLSKKIPSLNIKNFNWKEAEDFKELLADFDLIISAVSNSLGFEVLKKILQADKNVVSLSLFAENCFDLDYLAKKNQVTAVVDCGIAPGTPNIILGYLDTKLEVKNYECLVGGLPEKKMWPFNYKTPLPAYDVIQELIRPARYVENGELVTKPAFSDCEIMEIQRVGSLEAFNSDGLRTLVETMDHIPNMKEKTLRYPGHAEYMKVLMASGFFSDEELQIEGLTLRPAHFTAKILETNWQLKNSEEEFIVMRITIDGEENSKKRRYIYRMLDRGDKKENISSMARTSGYTATAVANYLLNHPLESGICAPEKLGAIKGCYDYIFNYLKDRGLDFRIEEFTLEN